MDDEDSTEDAYRAARSRAQANESGIGAAYLGPATRNPNAADWRGVFAIADRKDVTEVLVQVNGVSRHAPFDAEALARAVEEAVAERGGVRGHVVVLDSQRADFTTLFPPS